MYDHQPSAPMRSVKTSRRSFMQSAALLPAILIRPAPALGTVQAGTPPGYEIKHFEYGRIRKPIYSTGAGPSVFVLHDIRGLSHHCFAFADALAKKGYTVHLPRLFGPMPFPLGLMAACGGRRPLFSCEAEHDYGHVGGWLKALALEWAASAPAGVIGNCLTGALPLLMLRAPGIVAPVLCQPALPMGSAAEKGALGLPFADIEFARWRSKRDNIRILGVKYERDRLCPPDRFARLSEMFGGRFTQHLSEGSGHSTVLHDKPDAGILQTVFAFLDRQLLGKSA